MFSASFWLDAFERSVKTGVQFCIPIFVTSVTILGWDWKLIGSTFAAGFLISLCSSVLSAPVGVKGSASLLPDQSKNVPVTVPVDVAQSVSVGAHAATPPYSEGTATRLASDPAYPPTGDKTL